MTFYKKICSERKFFVPILWNIFFKREEFLIKTMPLKKKITSKKTMKKTSKPKKSSLARTVRKIAKAVVARNAESKEVWYPFGLAPTSIQNTTAVITGNLVQLTPSTSSYTIIQGVSDSQRIGNKVTVKKATLCYTIVPRPYDTTYNPLPAPTIVRVYLFRRKALPTTDMTAANVAGASADFFEWDGTQNQGFQASLGDMMKYVNKEKYTLLRYMTHKIGFQNSLTLGSTNSYEGYVNNDFKLNVMKKLDITNQFSKKMVWDDTSVTTASIVSPWLFMLIQPVNAAGLTYPATTVPVALTGSLHLEYQDE